MEVTSPSHSLLMLYENANLGQILSEYFERLGFTTRLSGPQLTPEDKKLITDRQFDLCILHVDCVGGNAEMALREIRELRDLPVFVIYNDSERAEKSVITSLYAAGADDVVINSFSPETFALKIKALLRRLHHDEQYHRLYTIGSLTFDSELQTLSKGEELLHHLSGKESELLLVLVHNMNHLVERGFILRKIWGMDNYFNGRSLSVYVNHLRHILEVEPSVRIISIHGKGYKMCFDDEVIHISFREDN